jgi:nucleoside-diphosphate-sugar epimerase
VTGCGGFVASHAVAVLRAAGHDVLTVGRTPRAGCDRAADLTDPAQTAACLEGGAPPDAVVHLAALAHGKGSGGEDAFDRVNHRGTRNLLAAARAAGVRRFVFASSAAVYGDAGRRHPVMEDAERRPVGAYARSKRDAEDACFRSTADGLPCVVLRFPAIYAREWLLDVRKRAYVPGTGGRFLLRVAGARPEYSLCAVQNAAQALACAASGALPPAAYNVADAAVYSQAEVADAVGRADAVRRTLTVPAWAVRLPLRAAAGVLPRSVSDGLDANYWKLFVGLRLDVGRIAGHGFRPAATLRSVLLGAGSAPR